MYAWGITANRSGDGETTVREPIMFSGGQLTDEAGRRRRAEQGAVPPGGPPRPQLPEGDLHRSQVRQMLPPGVNAWTDPSNNEAFLAGKIAFTSNAGTMFAKAVFDKNFTVADDTCRTTEGLGPKARCSRAPTAMRFFVMKGIEEQGGRRAADPPPAHAGHPARDLEDQHGYAFPTYEWGWDDPFFKEDKYASKMVGPWKETAFDPSGYTGGAWPGRRPRGSPRWSRPTSGPTCSARCSAASRPEDALKSAHDKAVRVAKEFGFKGE